MMDSNLHHPRWNPPTYRHTHSTSKELIKICGRKGFALASPLSIPTFLNPRGAQTTIDLCWINEKCKRHVQQCSVVLDNHASDHQPIHLLISIEGDILIPPSNRGITPERVDRERFTQDLENVIKTFPPPPPLL
jgi:hypothetical protein